MGVWKVTVSRVEYWSETYYVDADSEEQAESDVEEGVCGPCAERVCYEAYEEVDNVEEVK